MAHKHTPEVPDFDAFADRRLSGDSAEDAYNYVQADVESPKEPETVRPDDRKVESFLEADDYKGLEAYLNELEVQETVGQKKARLQKAARAYIKQGDYTRAKVIAHELKKLTPERVAENKVEFQNRSKALYFNAVLAKPHLYKEKMPFVDIVKKVYGITLSEEFDPDTQKELVRSVKTFMESKTHMDDIKKLARKPEDVEEIEKLLLGIILIAEEV